MTQAARAAVARSHRAAQELVVAHHVVATLSSEGRYVSRLDRVPQGLGRSPDFIITSDGVDVAVEHTRYLGPAAVQAAGAAVDRVEAGVKDLLASDVRRLGATVAVMVRYSVAALEGHDARGTRRDASAFAEAIREVLSREPSAREGALPALAAWVEDAEVGLLASAEPSLYFVKSPDMDHVSPDPDDFVRRTVESKGDQHAGFAAAGILAIQAMFADEVEDIELGLRRYPAPVPWWRVYVVKSEAHLVFERGDLAP